MMEPFINNDLDDRLDLTDDLMVDIGWVLLDSDGDGVPDVADNCKLAANGPNDTATAGPSQNDTNNDGFGNWCDADLDQSGFVNFGDLAVFKAAFGTADPNADLNGSGFVNFADLARFNALFGAPPGP